jgi:hypothetical protein
MPKIGSVKTIARALPLRFFNVVTRGWALKKITFAEKNSEYSIRDRNNPMLSILAFI